MPDQEKDENRSGRGWHGDPEGHAAAGRKGGSKISQDRSHMAQLGRKGGTKVALDRGHMAEIGRRGGQKVAQNRQHMKDIGGHGGTAKARNAANRVRASSETGSRHFTEAGVPQF